MWADRKTPIQRNNNKQAAIINYGSKTLKSQPVLRRELRHQKHVTPVQVTSCWYKWRVRQAQLPHSFSWWVPARTRAICTAYWVPLYQATTSALNNLAFQSEAETHTHAFQVLLCHLIVFLQQGFLLRAGCRQCYLNQSPDRSRQVSQGRTSRSQTNTHAANTPRSLLKGLQ